MLPTDTLAARGSAFFSLLVVGLLATGCAAPQAGPAELCPEASLPLWEVTSAEAPLFLMGSVHLLRPEVYPLDPALYEAFDQARLVAFELDFNLIEAEAPMLMQRGMYPAGQSLRDDVPAELYAEVEQTFAGFGVPVQAVERFRPWLASMMLTQLALQQGGYEAESGVDAHFFARAQEAGTPVVGLETMEDQIRVFEELSTEAQVAFLRSTLEDVDQTVEQLDEATEMWRRGDAEGIAEMMTEAMAEHPGLEDRLLFERNRAWIPAIEAFAASGEPTIVIAGMGHMVGDQSVVDLLRRQGHTVERAVGVCP